MYADDMKHSSVHASPWPEIDRKEIDEEAEKYGDLVMAIIEEVRRDKAERKMPLNTPIKNLIIYCEAEKIAHFLNHAKEDIEGTCKTPELKVLVQKGGDREIQGHPEVRFKAEY